MRARVQRFAGPAFFLLSLTMGLAALAARTLVALGTAGIVDWDETYYASTTATAAHGLGFYPYVLGYPEIPHMGGIGYVVTLYVLSYRLLGPHLFGLRLVSVLASLLAVWGLVSFTRRLYGPAAGLAAFALVPSLLLFQLSNTIRFDVFAIAFVAWALVLYVATAGRAASAGWHMLVGGVFALGLQVHLHTAAAAFAVGAAYLVDAAAALRGRAAWRLALRPVAAYVAGYVLGGALFLVLNVLPNPEGFFRTAALARLSAAESTSALNLSAPMDSGKLAATFLSPTVIVKKEVARYEGMFESFRGWELVLWVLGVPAFLLLRPAAQGVRTGVLLAGAVVGGGIVFNSSSPLYFAAILPFVVPALATLVTHGVGRVARIGRGEVRPWSAVVLLALAAAVLPGTLSRGARAARAAGVDPPAPPPLVVAVRAAASPECILAGPTELYADHFMAYPRFVGAREVEVLIGSTYYGLQEQPAAYWRRKRPDIVFGAAAGGLASYLIEAGYEPLADGVWRTPATPSEGCRITAARR